MKCQLVHSWVCAANYYFCMNCFGIWKRPKFTCHQVHFKLWQEKQLATIEYNLHAPFQFKWGIITLGIFKSVLNLESGGPLKSINACSLLYLCYKNQNYAKKYHSVIFRITYQIYLFEAFKCLKDTNSHCPLLHYWRKCLVIYTLICYFENYIPNTSIWSR